MAADTVGLKRLLVTFAVTLLWMSLLSAMHAFMTKNLWQGGLDVLVAVAVIVVARNSRLREVLTTKEPSRSGLVVFAFVVLLIVAYEAGTLQFTRPYLLDELYPPSVVLIAEAIGSLLLAAVAFAQIIVLFRRRA